MDAYRQGARSVLAVSPTGSGKTTLFTSLAAQLAAGGKRVLILVHRRELATQACTRLREFGVLFGLIMAGESPTPYARVQVASVQTLARRQMPPADLVIADEAHLSTAKTWTSILEHYPNARILGVTATPWRLSGKPLAGAYDSCVVVATPRELREQGHLCDYVGFSYLTPDLSDVGTVGGEYNEGETAKAMGDSLIVDNIVEEWQKHASQLSTVVFAVTVEHSRQLAARFVAAGVHAEHLDGGTPTGVRDAILRRVASGVTRVLCNVGVAVEGLDIPRLKCCVLARPTKSLARAIQMMGRVRRPWAECPCGYEFVPQLHARACPSCGGHAWRWVTARIHDHAFVIGQHGLPDADRDFTLSGKPEAPPSLSRCPECGAYNSGPVCRGCGQEHEPKPQGERVMQTVSEAGLTQYGFSSDGGVPMPDAPRSPVEVKWDRIGKMITGVFAKQWTEPHPQYGPQQRYLLQGEKRDHVIPGTAQLDRLMAKVPIGTPVEVKFTHETPIPGKSNPRKEFSVKGDDGKPDPDTAAMITRYAAGETFAALGKAFGVHPVSVRRRIMNAGVTPRTLSETITLARGHTAAVREKAVTLYRDGMKLVDVASTLGVSKTSVHEWVTSHE
jgi:DNA repair protein RadD